MQCIVHSEIWSFTEVIITEIVILENAHQPTNQHFLIIQINSENQQHYQLFINIFVSPMQ